jgi:hypothetical protein
VPPGSIVKFNSDYGWTSTAFVPDNPRGTRLRWESNSLPITRGSPLFVVSHSRIDDNDEYEYIYVVHAHSVGWLTTRKISQ